MLALPLHLGLTLLSSCTKGCGLRLSPTTASFFQFSISEFTVRSHTLQQQPVFLKPLLERPWGILSLASAQTNGRLSLSPSLQLQRLWKQHMWCSQTRPSSSCLVPPHLRSLTQLYLPRASPTHYSSAASPPLSFQTTMTSVLDYSSSFLNGPPDPVLTSLISDLTFRVSMDKHEPLCEHSSS